ncbi:MAG TPA: TraR/DksA C4-type zinc finger protein [Acidimicrobiales bacterium]|nr:TraR/DksA C4-type zinc finger protein [Acidimicrobiales bacterium]
MANDAPSVDLRGLLEQERETLLAQLRELGVGEGASITYDSNFADSSQVTAERGEAEALAASLRDTLDEVEYAIGKLESGTYGVCEGCDQRISPARLEAKPAARLCMDCASKR